MTVVLWRYNDRQQDHGDRLMANLEDRLYQAVEAAQHAAERSEEQVRRQRFESKLADAREMADGEREVIGVIERAFEVTLPGAPVELLLADNSHAHLRRTATGGHDSATAGCGVDSPINCPAARRGQTQRFEDSAALDACPKLARSDGSRCSAVCVPVSIMGRTVGVIHAPGETGAVVPDETVAELATLAKLGGARIGLLRAMAESELQATTDSLTGLLNRRSFAEHVALARGDDPALSVAVIDLDHFKQVNDTYGHETGDRALRAFAETLRAAVRSGDLVGRHGGEEFVIAFPDCGVVDAQTVLESVRSEFTRSTHRAGLPACTVSAGVVAALPGEDLPAVIARADAALFEAKRAGRDRVIAHDNLSEQLGRLTVAG
jgi:diguanylate cyclase (GGDEF)-like protein